MYSSGTFSAERRSTQRGCFVNHTWFGDASGKRTPISFLVTSVLANSKPGQEVRAQCRTEGWTQCQERMGTDCECLWVVLSEHGIWQDGERFQSAPVCPVPSQLGLPLCTWPFCFSALLFLMITSDNPALYKIPLCKVTYPEANRIYYLRMMRRASESRREEQKRKEQKPSCGSKISTGGTPLCTPKNSRAYWFPMSKSKQYQGSLSDASQALCSYKHHLWQWSVSQGFGTVCWKKHNLPLS